MFFSDSSAAFAGDVEWIGAALKAGVQALEGDQSMARIKLGKRAELVFEGVVIPRRTRSAKIAAKGIADEEDMGRFLTAIFSDTLKGKIILPQPGSRPDTKLYGVQHKLKHGLPVTIQPLELKRRKKRVSVRG